MAEHARRKLTTAGYAANVMVADAAAPPLREHSADVVLARHLLWTLPDPAGALRHWITLTRPGGRLILIEGRWNTEGDDTYVQDSSSLPWNTGVTAHTLATTLQPLVTHHTIEPLTDPTLWGKTITDERYALIAAL